jgi:hypothetical protein
VSSVRSPSSRSRAPSPLEATESSRPSDRVFPTSGSDGSTHPDRADHPTRIRLPLIRRADRIRHAQTRRAVPTATTVNYPPRRSRGRAQRGDVRCGTNGVAPEIIESLRDATGHVGHARVARHRMARCCRSIRPSTSNSSKPCAVTRERECRGAHPHDHRPSEARPH